MNKSEDDLELKEKAEKLAKRNYSVRLVYDVDGYWLAEHPELHGCMADGKTAQEALSLLDQSRALWIESRLATGLEIPNPVYVKQMKK